MFYWRSYSSWEIPFCFCKIRNLYLVGFLVINTFNFSLFFNWTLMPTTLIWIICTWFMKIFSEGGEVQCCSNLKLQGVGCNFSICIHVEVKRIRRTCLIIKASIYGNALRNVVLVWLWYIIFVPIQFMYPWSIWLKSYLIISLEFSWGFTPRFFSSIHNALQVYDLKLLILVACSMLC
jgi:hypothetical protein